MSEVNIEKRKKKRRTPGVLPALTRRPRSTSRLALFFSFFATHLTRRKACPESAPILLPSRPTLLCLKSSLGIRTLPLFVPCCAFLCLLYPTKGGAGSGSCLALDAFIVDTKTKGKKNMMPSPPKHTLHTGRTTDCTRMRARGKRMPSSSQPGAAGHALISGCAS